MELVSGPQFRRRQGTGSHSFTEYTPAPPLVSSNFLLALKPTAAWTTPGRPVGVGTRVAPITRDVPIYIHDYIGTGRHAKVVSGD